MVEVLVDFVWSEDNAYRLENGIIEEPSEYVESTRMYIDELAIKCCWLVGELYQLLARCFSLENIRLIKNDDIER